MVTIIEILKQIPLFQGLEEGDLKKISEVVKEQTLAAGSCLFKEGDQGDAFYLIKEGAVEVYKKDNDAEKLVNKIAHTDESNFFGEMALIEGGARNATVKTVSECKVLMIDKTNFDMLLRLNSFIALRIMTALSRRLRKDSAPKAEEKCGKIITFFAPKGGAGKSVIAANMVAGIAKLTKKTALIIDLDLQFGDLAFMLGLKGKKTIADVVEAEPTTPDDLKKFLTEHALGFSILPSPIKPEQSEMVNSTHLRKIIKIAQKMFDFIVIDTHSLFQDLTINALDISDVICLVMSPEMNHIKSMHVCMKVMETLKYPAEKIRLLLSREDCIYAKPRADIETALKRKFDFSLHDDWKSASEMINDQKTIFDRDTQSAYRSDMMTLIASLTGEKLGETKSGFLGSIKKLFGN
ncbi:MAG TPA: cyclic nucleotide-binding domain-containing protein [Candidatus Rifleibacterium sp.]|nr:cyclic nucleotide-binding domain-containing protein [Candidatus Rifleibacterium sp.]HPT46614.1 cyclic nucleotide-binding domain-containing protein [Candidatus Rifleibacterium sp.]